MSDELDEDQLATQLKLPPEEADRLGELLRCADMAHARARFGYAKDNDIPPPLAARMADPSYRAALIAVAGEEEEPMPALLAALDAMG
jgi:hypothetical protein